MNEFTKEELNTVLAFVIAYTDFGASWTDKSRKEIIDKIIYMKFQLKKE